MWRSRRCAPAARPSRLLRHLSAERRSVPPRCECGRSCRRTPRDTPPESLRSVHALTGPRHQLPSLSALLTGDGARTHVSARHRAQRLTRPPKGSPPPEGKAQRDLAVARSDPVRSHRTRGRTTSGSRRGSARRSASRSALSDGGVGRSLTSDHGVIPLPCCEHKSVPSGIVGPSSPVPPAFAVCVRIGIPTWWWRSTRPIAKSRAQQDERHECSDDE
jgi:hypothetical protein